MSVPKFYKTSILITFFLFLSPQLSDINAIISPADYLKNNNDQSVVEICITRVLSCIRETKTAEKYCSALIDLLKTCLQWNLGPTGGTKEDPPHAKIAADIISSIFLVSSKQTIFYWLYVNFLLFCRTMTKRMS